MQKARVFIGSSSEGLRIAEAVFAAFQTATEPTLWTHQLFRPGRYPLDELEQQLRRHSFAVLVASPDDEVFKRGESSAAMRDNLLVEFGMFVGAIGRTRTFLVCPNDPELDLPSDLAGIIQAKYDAERASRGSGECAAAVQVACQQIRDAVEEEWNRIQREAQSRATRPRKTEQGQALERLSGVAIQA